MIVFNCEYLPHVLQLLGLSKFTERRVFIDICRLGHPGCWFGSCSLMSLSSLLRPHRSPPASAGLLSQTCIKGLITIGAFIGGIDGCLSWWCSKQVVGFATVLYAGFYLLSLQIDVGILGMLHFWKISPTVSSVKISVCRVFLLVLICNRQMLSNFHCMRSYWL